jgi:hypothetical protein
MQTELAATRTKIDEIFAVREDLHDQTALAAEYHRLTEREDALLLAIRGRILYLTRDARYSWAKCVPMRSYAGSTDGHPEAD